MIQKYKYNGDKMKKVSIYITKILLCAILFLSLAILCKKSTRYKEKIKYELYENHLSYSKFKELYNHYLGGYMPLENIINKKEESVFNEKISYTKEEKYQEGVKLEVQNNYLVPSQETGVVVYVGEKENYGNTIIIEGKNDIDTWYGNICNSQIKLYDYVEKGKYLGETCNNNLYLVYTKKNKFLDYKDYLT